jgi:esterase/lipase
MPKYSFIKKIIWCYTIISACSFLKSFGETASRELYHFSSVIPSTSTNLSAVIILPGYDLFAFNPDCANQMAEDLSKFLLEQDVAVFCFAFNESGQGFLEYTFEQKLKEIHDKVQNIKSNPQINPTAIGVIGLGEVGLLATSLLGLDKDIQFLITASSPLDISNKQQIVKALVFSKMRNNLDGGALSQLSELDSYKGVDRRKLDDFYVKLYSSTWYKNFLDLQDLPARKIRISETLQMIQ